MAADGQHKRRMAVSGLYFVLALLAVLVLQSVFARYSEKPPRRVPYSEFLSDVEAGRVQEAEVRASEIVAKLRAAAKQQDQKNDKQHDPKPEAATRGASEPERIITTRIPGVEDEQLVEMLSQHGVTFSGRIEQASWWQAALGWVVPIIVLAVIYSWLLRRMGRGAGPGPMSFGKSRVKIYDQTQRSKATFEDVAGVDEAEDELREVVDFLKHPAKYQSLGARIPKGVLLVGPPGTGKTLLAKAVAGEADVPFFSISASEFIEMFVGVGAARMRDVFEQAKQRAPCIVFIDELDAIGKSRGGLGAMATHDEREQTLNQLLVEMDGFEAGGGVVIMAATNRPEVLDAALVRAGRFDRQVLVDRPDLRGRLEILKIHARGVDIDNELDLEVVARRTPGMVGADLANIVNEAALSGARRGAKVVQQQDFEEAIDRIQLGLKKRGHTMNEEEKRRVAYHEAGHALVALSVPQADPVHRVSIIPRSIGALGVTLQLPTDERYLLTREELRDRMCVMLGGRVAEEIVCGDISTGAENDLERVTETARQMVCRFGMSDRLGTQTFGRNVGMRFLQHPLSMGEERNFSEETAQQIDSEVHALIEEQHERARQILTERRAQLEKIGERLLAEETLEKEELERIAAGVAAVSG